MMHARENAARNFRLTGLLILALLALAALSTRAAEPARELFDRAQAALNDDEYSRAADLLAELLAEHADAPEATEALYWRAFALYRHGGSKQLAEAGALLEQLSDSDASEGLLAEGESLAARIDGRQARRGDPEAYVRVVELAGQASQAEALTRAEARELRRSAQSLRTAERARSGGIRLVRPRSPHSPRAPHSIRYLSGGSDEPWDARLAALDALMSMDSEKAMPILAKVLADRSEEKAPLRRKAVFLVAQHGGEQATALLKDVVTADPDEETRVTAVRWLGLLPEDEALPILESVLDGGEAKLLRPALFALAEMDRPRARQRLRELVLNDDTPADIRADALMYYSESDDPDMAATLGRVYRQAEDDHVRERALMALAESDDPAAKQVFETVLRDESAPLSHRRLALQWASLGGQFDTEDLSSLYGDLKEDELRKQLVMSLAETGDDAAFDLLLTIAREDPDPSVRQMAIFWIGQSGDERAADFLDRIINE